ncbi:MAG: ABC transporter ATP-binding protein [Actinomycetia bacterium]|nr:ABC transporter ATP-binding protein [Actinomycetes bacterium]MCP3912805.1 ABC transporter ATP-binding protein [Actinomycetes bacterium]
MNLSTLTAPRPTRNDVAAPAQLLQARDVVRVHRTGDQEVRALNGVDLDIGAGEYVVVMGPSGNGKTTLLNCLSGLDQIDGGTVEIDGRNIHRLSDRARTAHRAERMGFVFQAFNLVSVFDAAENVELPLLASGVKPRSARKRAAAMLDRVGLGERLTHRPTELSGGEQQRVAIARALVTEPAIVWADEPTGNLDSRTAESVLELFDEVHRAGQTLVVVTHDSGIGQRGTRLVEIRDGRVAADQTRVAAR